MDRDGPRDGKPMISCTVGERAQATVREFRPDLASRVSGRIQLKLTKSAAHTKPVRKNNPNSPNTEYPQTVDMAALKAELEALLRGEANG